MAFAKEKKESPAPTARPLELDKTKAAITKIISDLKLFSRCVSAFVSILIIAYYLYSLIANIGVLYSHIISAVILLISVASLVYDIVFLEREHRQTRQRRKRIIRIILLIIHIVLSGFAVYDAIKFNTSFAKLLFALFTCLGVASRIVIEFFRYSTENYLSLLYQGIKMDVEEFTNSKPAKMVSKTADTFGNFRASVAELADKGVVAFSRLVHRGENESTEAETEDELDEEPSLTEKEKEQRDILYAIANEQNQEKDKLHEQREEKKKARLRTAVENLKDHTKGIFK